MLLMVHDKTNPAELLFWWTELISERVTSYSSTRFDCCRWAQFHWRHSFRLPLIIITNSGAPCRAAERIHPHETRLPSTRATPREPVRLLLGPLAIGSAVRIPMVPGKCWAQDHESPGALLMNKSILELISKSRVSWCVLWRCSLPHNTFSRISLFLISKNALDNEACRFQF